MNDKIANAADAAHDVAFEPMDAPAIVGGPQSDGTVSYKIVEGDTFIDGVKVEPKVVGYVQIDEEIAG